MPYQWKCTQGACLLIPSGPENKKHLYTIITNPTIIEHTNSKLKVISVGFASIKEGTKYDTACVVKAGDHPFIKHESYLAYRHARLDEADSITRMVLNGSFTIKDPCSPFLIERIINGAIESKQISREYINIIRNCV